MQFLGGDIDVNKMTYFELHISAITFNSSYQWVKCCIRDIHQYTHVKSHRRMPTNQYLCSWSTNERKCVICFLFSISYSFLIIVLKIDKTSMYFLTNYVLLNYFWNKYFCIVWLPALIQIMHRNYMYLPCKQICCHTVVIEKSVSWYWSDLPNKSPTSPWNIMVMSVILPCFLSLHFSNCVQPIAGIIHMGCVLLYLYIGLLTHSL